MSCIAFGRYTNGWQKYRAPITASRMAACRSSRPRLKPRFRLHHWAALFITGLFMAHLIITWQSIQQEQVWSPESPVGLKLMRGLKVSLHT